MLTTLITSKIRVRLITWFVTHSGQRFHYNQLLGIIKASGPSLHSELKRLENAGLLSSAKEANVKFYWVNQDFILYPEIKSIIFKTVGLADALREALEKIGDIEVAFIYGSVAKNLEDAKSDIDLMVIGDVDMDELHEAIAKQEEMLGREINYTVFDKKDWQKQIHTKRAFAYDIYRGKKIYLIGGENELRKLSQRKGH